MNTDYHNLPFENRPMKCGLTKEEVFLCKAISLKNGIDGLVLQTLERWHVPGLALAVVSGNEVLHLEGYAQRDLARGLPVTPKTLFLIASMIKSCGAMSLGLLVDEGKLEWDKPVHYYRPAGRCSTRFPPRP